MPDNFNPANISSNVNNPGMKKDDPPFMPFGGGQPFVGGQPFGGGQPYYFYHFHHHIHHHFHHFRPYGYDDTQYMGY